MVEKGYVGLGDRLRLGKAVQQGLELMQRGLAH